MKPVYVVAAILAVSTPFANAVDFNKDAMKSMQDEGHKILEDSKGARTYKTSNGLCLDFAGAALLVKKCNAKANSQKWLMDGQSRLVANDKRCVAGAQLKKCGSGQNQKWQLDNSKRLANGAKKCLQVPGNPPKAGAKLVASGCSKAANQVWK